MTKPLGTLLQGVTAYCIYLADHPDKALTAPAWRELTDAAQTRWRERAVDCLAVIENATDFDRLLRQAMGGAKP